MTALPKKRRRKATALVRNDDTEALGIALNALVQGFGRGGLSWLSRKLGFDLSPLRRRLLKTGAGMDPITMRATVLIANQRADQHKTAEVLASREVGPFVIEMRQHNGETFPTWRVKE